MTSSADVAVIVAAYNAAPILEAALASVAGQSTQPGQVIVADDASVDDTAGVARRWSSLLPIDVIRLPTNRGPALARRRAVKAAKSPLLVVLDADDVWLPDHLATMLGEYRHPATVVSANASRWMPGRGLHPDSYQHVLPIPAPDRQVKEILRRNFVFYGSLFSREAYEAVGGYRVESTGAEDWDLWIRMIRSGCRVRPSLPVTCLYRRAAGSLSTTVSGYDGAVNVLVTARSEATGPSERRIARRTFREHKARLELLRAYEVARNGELGARRHAAKALTSPWPVAIRAAAMLVRPVEATKRRDRMATNW